MLYAIIYGLYFVSLVAFANLTSFQWQEGGALALTLLCNVWYLALESSSEGIRHLVLSVNLPVTIQDRLRTINLEVSYHISVTIFQLLGRATLRAVVCDSFQVSVTRPRYIES
jgi:hypothetical protein